MITMTLPLQQAEEIRAGSVSDGPDPKFTPEQIAAACSELEGKATAAGSAAGPWIRSIPG